MAANAKKEIKGVQNMQSPDFVPLGTICTLQGNDKKLMVIARGLILSQDDGEQRYYDYGGCLYPEGLIGDAILYFNHDVISEVVFEGFADGENNELLEDLSANMLTLSVERGNPEPLTLSETPASAALPNATKITD
jgi:hypothetical protein